MIKYSKNLDLKLSLSATNWSYVIASTEKGSNHMVSFGVLEKLLFFFCICIFLYGNW